MARDELNPVSRLNREVSLVQVDSLRVPVLPEQWTLRNCGWQVFCADGPSGSRRVLLILPIA
jgi:hypothetical protein